MLQSTVTNRQPLKQVPDPVSAELAYAPYAADPVSGVEGAPNTDPPYRVNQATPRCSASDRPSRVTSHSGFSTARRCPPSRCTGRITAPIDDRV